MKGPLVQQNHPVTGIQIQISKNNGFCQVNDFYEFPDNNSPDSWRRWAVRWGGTYAETMLFRQVVDWNVPKAEIFDFSLGEYFGEALSVNLITGSTGSIGTASLGSALCRTRFSTI